MATVTVRFRGGPCDGRTRLLTFLYAPTVLHCGGDVYNLAFAPPGKPLLYVWNELTPVPVPGDVVGGRDVLRAFKAFMQARVRATRRVHDESARAIARIRRAVR